MDVFRWDQYYVTGLQEVDDQRMRLMALINRLGNIVANGEGSDTEAIPNLLPELADYAVYHFAE